MNVEIGTEAAQFPEKEYINWIFLAVHAMQVKTALPVTVSWADCVATNCPEVAVQT
jgi:hypothetical protein